MFLYLVTNTVNGKQYVGITRLSVHRRWMFHVNAARRRDTDSVLAQAIRKYGAECFDVVTLASADTWEELCVMEKKMIRILGTHVDTGNGYNMTDGGEQGHGYTEATRRKIAASLRGNIPWNKGKKAPTGKPAWNTGKSSSRKTQELATRTVKRALPWLHRPIGIGDSIYASITEACIVTGFSRSTIHKWLLNGKARYVDTVDE